VALVGYRQEVQDQIQLTLGGTADLRFALATATLELEPVTVTATSNPVFSAERTGAATTIAAAQNAHLPTISRRVEDLLRLTPQYSAMSFGFSFAGQDNRFNNMTIDGSYFNNSFGLAGQPGDRTGVAPVSLDALEQLQVNVAPYDVRQGNFVGAGINMVTKSGTNDVRGSLFYNTRNDNFVGTTAGPNTFNPGSFKYHDIGVALGGPIIRNRLFFFGSYENDGQTGPGTTFLANNGSQPDSGNVTRVLASDLDALSSYLKSNFNYVTGPYQGYDFKVPSTRFLTRLDYNLSYRSYQLQDNYTIYLPKHSLTFGVSVEKYHSTNVFFPGAQSIYVYNSLADFYTDANGYLANPNRTAPSPVTLRRFQVEWSNIPGQSEPVQPLDVLYAGVYAQDEWRPVANLTLTGGLRIDAPKFKNTAYDNPVADTMTLRDAGGAPVHYNSGMLPGVNLLISPRLGFNYDVQGEQKTQIRA